MKTFHTKARNLLANKLNITYRRTHSKSPKFTTSPTETPTANPCLDVNADTVDIEARLIKPEVRALTERYSRKSMTVFKSVVSR